MILYRAGWFGFVGLGIFLTGLVEMVVGIFFSLVTCYLCCIVANWIQRMVREQGRQISSVLNGVMGRDGNLHDDWERFLWKYFGKEPEEIIWGIRGGKLLREGSLILMWTLVWIVRHLTWRCSVSSGARKKTEAVPSFHHIPNWIVPMGEM